MATLPDPNEPQPTPEVATQLHQRGLAATDLREAARAGHDEAIRCTENDVATRAGYLRWATPLRYLGDIYVPKGWTRDRPHGFERLVSPDKTFALGVAPGSYSTGTDRMPSTRIDRGPLTGQAVAHNRGQLSFDSNVHYMFGAEPSPGLLLWLLLHYFDQDDSEIRLELSVPVEFSRTSQDGRGFVTRFEPRLILPTIVLADQANVDDDEDEGDEPIEVPVSRR